MDMDRQDVAAGCLRPLAAAEQERLFYLSQVMSMSLLTIWHPQKKFTTFSAPPKSAGPNLASRHVKVR